MEITKDTQENLPEGVITLAYAYARADAAFRDGDHALAAAWGRVWLLILGRDDGPEDEDDCIRDAVQGSNSDIFVAMYG